MIEPLLLSIANTIRQVIDQFISFELKQALANIRGIKGLVLVSCGSSLSKPQHFASVQRLVKRYAISCLGLPRLCSHS